MHRNLTLLVLDILDFRQSLYVEMLIHRPALPQTLLHDPHIAQRLLLGQSPPDNLHSDGQAVHSHGVIVFVRSAFDAVAGLPLRR